MQTEQSLIDPEALEIMVSRGGDWYAYENVALDSAMCGHLQFLQCGEGRTFPEPPKHMPDTHLGLGWRYYLKGKVNIETGGIDL